MKERERERWKGQFWVRKTMQPEGRVAIRGGKRPQDDRARLARVAIQCERSSVEICLHIAHTRFFFWHLFGTNF